MKELRDHSEEQPREKSEPSPEDEAKPGLLQVLGSVLAAIFGVQSQRKRARDFQRGDPRDYILVYTLLVIAIAVGMAILVRVVLSAHGV